MRPLLAALDSDAFRRRRRWMIRSLHTMELFLEPRLCSAAIVSSRRMYRRDCVPPSCVVAATVPSRLHSREYLTIGLNRNHCIVLSISHGFRHILALRDLTSL
jgi:hypothetical protein